MSEPVRRRLREELIDLSLPQRIHVVGVAGPGMAPLSVVLSGTGHRVSGSDLHDSETLDIVRREGVDVHIGHSEHLVEDVDVVVYSTAIPDTNVERVRGQQRGIAVQHRSGALAALCRQYETIGVAGTHGKSTTSALLTHMLIATGNDPTAIVGADVPGLDAGARVGTSQFFVLESDESDGTLEVLPLKHLVVTNIDVDHLDYFGTFEQLKSAMGEVINRVDGCVVMNADDDVSTSVMSRVRAQNLQTFGRSSSAHVRLERVTTRDEGLDVELVVNQRVLKCFLPLRGGHNAMNLAAAIAMLDALGIDLDQACASLADFNGVLRRFTERGHYRGALLVDDYAHLPAEISAAISAMRSHPAVTKRVVAVFQPNRFHRIEAMAEAYANCFTEADLVVITDIYASGTRPIEGVTGKLVWQAIVDAHPDAACVWAPTRQDIVNYVAEFVQPGDGCISMGCGDIETFPDDLMKASLR
ncbi:MAG: UDP-N-acetylmuramate--L-alanine ligase [Actinomycetota bacterium]